VSSERNYDVVVNDEEQYSIWLVGRELPAGWRTADFRGSKEDCLAHIASVWTDLRPLSLRQRDPQTV
jgi:MbtH protein